MYGTLADADTYFLTEYLDIGKMWAQEPDENKTAALNMATTAINNLNFVGEKADDAQVNAFPRGTDTVVPSEIEHACYHCAYEFLDGNLPELEARVENSLGGTIGPVRQRNDDVVPVHVRAGIPSVTAWRLLYPFLHDGQAITLNRVN